MSKIGNNTDFNNASNGIMQKSNRYSFMVKFHNNSQLSGELLCYNPIYKGTVSPILKYLIKEDGSTYAPSTNDVTYYNIIDSFEKNKNIYIKSSFQNNQKLQIFFNIYI